MPSIGARASDSSCDEPSEIREADAERIHEIAAEFARGFDQLATLSRAVTIFGSARTPREHPSYALTREVAAALGGAGYAIITGGGGGLMEAANRGARDAGDQPGRALVPDARVRAAAVGDRRPVGGGRRAVADVSSRAPPA